MFVTQKTDDDPYKTKILSLFVMIRQAYFPVSRSNKDFQPLYLVFLPQLDYFEWSLLEVNKDMYQLSIRIELENNPP